jgi:hypothetical protein
MTSRTRIEHPATTAWATRFNPLTLARGLALLLMTPLLANVVTPPPVEAIVGGQESQAPYSFMGSLQPTISES